MSSQSALLQCDRQKENRENEKRFNVSREIPKITSIEGHKLIQEVVTFERRIDELNVTSSREIFRISEMSVQGAARQ